MSFLIKHFKKALLAIALVGAVTAGATVVDAQMQDSRMIPNNLWRQITTTAIAPISTTLELGSSSIRIAKGWFTALDATTITVGTFTTGLTQGSVVFVGAAGALDQDNANFFIDNTNNRLGVGTNTPTVPLTLLGGNAASATLPALLVTRTDVTANVDTIATFQSTAVADPLAGSVSIVNNTTVASTFSAAIRMTSSASTVSSLLRMVGATGTDSGTTPVGSFDARISTSTAVATRPLFNWTNNATTVATISGTTAGSYFGTSFGRVKAVRSVASTTITVAVTDHIVLSSTGGGAVAVSLPATPETGREYTIKDNVGDANTNNITITPAAGNIDGAGTNVINTAYGFRTLVYNGTQWNVVSQ